MKPCLYARDCPHRDKKCSTCGREGHLAATCRHGGDKPSTYAADESKGGGKKEVNRVSFAAQRKKKQSAMAEAKYGEFEEAYALEVIEVEATGFGSATSSRFLGDFGTNRHVANDPAMLWDKRKLAQRVKIR